MKTAKADAREALLRKTLDDVRARADLRARRAADPVDFVHRYQARVDRELVALVAANLAFGNVKAIRLKVAELLDRVGPSPSKAADDPARLHELLDGWKHRVFKGEDVAKLLAGARKVQREAGSLGKAFAAALKAADRAIDDEHEALREALAAFCDRLRVAGGLPLPGASKRTDRRGPVSILSNARAGGGAKRLLLFLRWMMRPADGIDLGLWGVPARRLLMPVDVHIHKLALNLGLTRRSDVSWKTAVEITTALARFDPTDPTRYDFSLCHMGMLQRCPSRRDPVRCEGCGVRPVCIRWQTSQRTA
ncbi:MAG: TIGR02757 family protein [Labilithrix sp.]|nr:TIGR02757 family protein [Labilithrix sp.]MCW5814337.1 TIGR02757 family protein [Labilithrix sp.]